MKRIACAAVLTALVVPAAGQAADPIHVEDLVVPEQVTAVVAKTERQLEARPRVRVIATAINCYDQQLGRTDLCTVGFKLRQRGRIIVYIGEVKVGPEKAWFVTDLRR
jgi:hypothetical protein